MLRIGQSSDIHRFKPGDYLVIGGEVIKACYGCDAHSDGDALVHAIAEAILGALALGDIGTHFPDTDERYHNINSLELLAEVSNLMHQQGYEIVNIDSLILIEKVKMAPYINKMQANLASVLNIDINQVSVKATRGEKMGFIGHEEGFAAQAVVLLQNENQ